MAASALNAYNATLLSRGSPWQSKNSSSLCPRAHPQRLLLQSPLKRESSSRVAATGVPEKTSAPAPAELPVAPQVGSANSQVPSPPAPATSQSVKPATPPSFDEIMAFDGAPEIINGRLAMLGFAWGALVELTQGVSFIDQISDPSQPGIFFASVTMATITLASFAPILSTATAPKKFLFFTQEAEMINGRVAMLGFSGVLLFELLGNSIAKLF